MVAEGLIFFRGERSAGSPVIVGTVERDIEHQTTLLPKDDTHMSCSSFLFRKVDRCLPFKRKQPRLGF